MNARFRNRHPRAFAALFIVGVGLAFLGLLALQVLTPLILGPAGLVLVLVLDTTLVAAYHHPRRRPRTRRWPLITFGPVDKRYRTQRRDALETEFVATSALVVFLIAVYALGFTLRTVYLGIGPDDALFIVGSVMTTVGVYVLAPWWGQFVPWGYWAQLSESEKYDTVEDH